MAKKFIFLLVVSFISFQGVAMASELIDDIKQARAKDRSTSLNVSNIVSKYIKSDSLWDEISERLIKDGFECSALPQEKSNLSLIAYSCNFDLRKWYEFGFGDMIKIYISVKNNRVNTSKGYLFYLAI